jgi:hypothetical protein
MRFASRNDWGLAPAGRAWCRRKERRERSSSSGCSVGSSRAFQPFARARNRARRGAGVVVLQASDWRRRREHTTPLTLSTACICTYFCVAQPLVPTAHTVHEPTGSHTKGSPIANRTKDSKLATSRPPPIASSPLHLSAPLLVVRQGVRRPAGQ